MSNAVMINGITYASEAFAARSLGVSAFVIRKIGIYPPDETIDHSNIPQILQWDLAEHNRIVAEMLADLEKATP